MTQFSSLCAARKASSVLTGLFSETLLTAVRYSQLKDTAASISHESRLLRKLAALSTKCASDCTLDSLSACSPLVVVCRRWRTLHSSSSQYVPDSLESVSLCRPAATREKHLPGQTCAACVRGRRCVAEPLTSTNNSTVSGQSLRSYK